MTDTSASNSAIDETACVLCQLFPEQVKDHAKLHHKLDIQDGKLVELPIEPPPDKPSVEQLQRENARLTALVERLRERILREEAFRHRLGEGVRQLLNYDPDVKP